MTATAPGSTLTDAELRALRAVWQHGGIIEAAHSLGVSRSTLHRHLANARSRLGVQTTLAAIKEAGVGRFTG